MKLNHILRKKAVDCKYGAPLGRSHEIDPNNPVLHVQRVQPIDGDYSADGTYWGLGQGTEPMYCGFNGTNLIFVRAWNRVKALRVIREQYPWAQFFVKPKGLALP